ncbi:hypothetical protein ACOY9X_27370, partial [Citrobacter freundii complex sp. 2024EL-00748]
SLKTSIKTITNLSDSNCLEIQGASLASCCDAEYTAELKSALESAIDRAEAAEKRIVELEARTVTLPDVEKWRSVDAVRAQNAYKVFVSKVLAAAGIGVKVGAE